jgi:hypothetical protein
VKEAIPPFSYFLYIIISEKRNALTMQDSIVTNQIAEVVRGFLNSAGIFSSSIGMASR